MVTLQKGKRIYYNGDMANNPGFGTITEIIRDKWGEFVYIKMDDGRNINRLPIAAFSEEFKDHGGTRFVTLEAYEKYRSKMLKNMGIAD